MPLTPANTCTLSYSASLPATNDRVGFQQLDWADIGNVESIPPLGTQRSIRTYTPLVDGSARYYRTTRDHPELAVRVAFASSAALSAMRTARQASTRYAFRVRFSDARGGLNPSARCFLALVTSVSEEPGAAAALVMATITLRPQPDSYVEIPRGVYFRTADELYYRTADARYFKVGYE